MIDEAKRKGIVIDVEHLSQDLGVPVVPTIAIRGKGSPNYSKKPQQRPKRGE